MDEKSQSKLTGEPIAIIGVGCRFPGAKDLESLWRILRDRVETVAEYPGGRFHALDRLYENMPGERTGFVTRRGGFLKDLDLFDANFFSISPRETVLLDPQHRLLLELGWEALEDAGIPLAAIAGSRTGVFVGQWTSDFETCINESLINPEFYSTTGSGRYAAAGRLAYHFDLRGPNLTLDTGCSSSLVAIHLACQSLRNGESEVAFAGAVNLILRAEVTLAYGAAGMLSPDGRCKFGDASANGYVRSEGGAVVLLKPLSRAIADRDPIHAVVRGSSVKNDGHSSGLLVSPSREGQIATIRAALDDAGISAAEVNYIEAHGTGTPVGDPVELEAIGTVLCDTPRARPCLVGSVKTNLGHLEAAAGMAGLCKVIMSFRHGSVPATLHFREPNPNVPWSKLPLAISAEAQPWPHDNERRVAGLNSIGITGTNAHAILENAPVQESHVDNSERARLFVLSARSPEALEQTAAAWRSRMREETQWPTSMADLAYTAAVRRTAHPFRLAVVAKNARDLDAQLAAWLEHGEGDSSYSGIIERNPLRVVFVFPGQGGQWAGMGRGLFEQNAVFREAIMLCDRALRPHTSWSLIEEILCPNVAKANDIDRVQPALFGVMIALAEMWRSWGVEPEAVVGHSMGEAAAAVVSGALTIEDGAAVIAKRSQLMKTVSGCGQMAMTALTFAEATEFVRSYRGRVSIAANNSPSTTVLSGDTSSVEAAIAALEAREVFCRRIQVDVASHSAQMDPLAPELEQSLASIVPKRTHIPLYSTSSGRLEDGLSLGPSYWSRNLRAPVLFADAVRQLLKGGFQTFVEINPHPVLTQAIEEGAKNAGKRVVAIASQRREKEQMPEILGSLGKLHVSGYRVDFLRIYPAGKCLRLPTYPWQRERYWPEEDQEKEKRLTFQKAHPLMGTPVEFSLNPGTWLCDVAFRPPAGGPEAAGWCLDLVVAAAREILGTRDIVLEDVCFSTITTSSESGQLAMVPGSNGEWRFRLSAKTGEVWRTCCEGNILGKAVSSEVPAVRALRSAATSLRALTACFQAATESFGPTDGEARRTIRHIDRVEWFGVDGIKQMDLRTTAVSVNDTCANAEVRDVTGSCVLRMAGIRLDVRYGDCSQHIYQWKWTETEFPATAKASSGVFVIAGDSALTAQIANHRGSRKIEQVVASDLSAVRRMVESLGSACKSVVWISAVRGPEPTSAVEQVWNVCSLVGSMAASDIVSYPELWLVTTGAQRVEGNPDSLPIHGPLSVSQSAIWGLARAIACERPEIRCISIDLSPYPDEQEFEVLQRLMTSNTSEEHIAVRGSKCYGLRLEHLTESDPVEVQLKKDGSYLVTGGFGDLGLELAEFLAERGAGHVALVGRRAPDARVRERINQIEGRGVRVQGFQADVANDAAIASVLGGIVSIAPLKGVFHLAGVAQDALLTDISRESLEQVMRPKVLGSWNLHNLTRDADLDYFVLYSSLATVSSQPGQGSYAAANAYMDGLATMRRIRGVAGTSIQWGPWKDAGMIRDPGASRSSRAWASQGIGALSKAMGLDGLHRLLARPIPVAFIAPVDWKRFSHGSRGKTSPLFSSLVEPADKTFQEDIDLREQLKLVAPLERAARLELVLKGIVAAVLKSKSSRIDATSRFGSMGVDSLMAVEIARRATDILGVPLPATAIFNFPTLELLTQEMTRRMDLVARVVPSQNLTGVDRPITSPLRSLSEIAELSEEEALQSLVKLAEEE
jgi:acyl transferase domain-containing protein/NAD(P)-dependent dehydrogenase (short-subunit alcohol dehydrogenase family)/acyl carrier protein